VFIAVGENYVQPARVQPLAVSLDAGLDEAGYVDA
jgi:hypothetical protein